MKAILILNEIKQKIKGTGLETIGIGKSGFLKGYYLLKNKLKLDLTLKNKFEEFRNNKFFEKKYENSISLFESAIKEITDSNLDDLAIIAGVDASFILDVKKDAPFPHMFTHSDKWTDVMMPKINGRIFGEEWNYQILYNNEYKIGYIELYVNTLITGKNGPALFNYFVKYK